MQQLAIYIIDQSERPLPAFHAFYCTMPQDAKHFFSVGPNMGNSDIATAIEGMRVQASFGALDGPW